MNRHRAGSAFARTLARALAVAAGTLTITSACARGTRGGAAGEASKAPAPAPASTPSTAPTTAREPAVRAIDPAAPVAPADYTTTIATRRTQLLERGLRLGNADVGYYMDVQEARFRQLIGSSLLLTRRDQSVVLEFPGQLSFEVGSARLSGAAQAALAGVAKVLVDYRFTIVSVDGHTDDSGDAATNRTLSEQRAAAVARHLITEGVEAERLVVVGHGSDRPVADNATEVGREANRRVVLRIDPLRR